MISANQKKPINHKTWHIFLVISISLFSFLGCELLEDKEDECEATAAGWIELYLFPDVKITHANGDAFDGYVTFEVYKTYCDGTISGNFTKETVTDPDGFADFYYRYVYDLKNTEDIIYFKYIINQGDESYEKKGEITYNRITQEEIYSEDDDSYIYKMEMHSDFYNEEAIVLPWNK